MTTTIPRPQERRASDRGRSRLGDIRRRRRLPRADRITPQRRSAWLFGLAALVVAGSIGAALFGLPVRTWFEQDDQLQGLEHELSELQTVNNDLQDEVSRLQTDDGVVEAAREELGQVRAGDNRQTMLALPPLPRDLPEGWPYSQVDSILSVREAADAQVATDGSGRAAPGPGDGGGWILPLVPTVPPAPVASPSTAATATTVAGSSGATTVPAAATTIPTPSTAPSNP